jgi:hypothetical protein
LNIAFLLTFSLALHYLPFFQHAQPSESLWLYGSYYVLSLQ